ncbi:TIGR02281 family clan AA aspartic protease [Aestuariibacter sp. GS-14]|uniref:retropepsin-like aspartic protease family protein n=1 Tax=Aestuariibacter sp. GS-14 TaxID=2590670 RepID=UPI001125D410|nr:retropepsin-like aspartic protease [Aestuariibacter sp. GS-14]TPV60721.1 TIGR02281 family clan AA aspartic protease [Aestuariibacter sp. GS-14]
MSRYTQVVTVALLCSMALNAFLLFSDDDSPSPYPTESVHRHNAPQSSESPAMVSVRQSVPDQSSVASASPSAQRRTLASTESIAESIALAREWLEAGEFGNVEAFIQRMIRNHFTNPELLLLEADWFLATQPLALALAHIYELLDSGMLPAGQQDKLAIRAESLRDEAIRALYEGHEWDMLAQFIEPLFQLFPTDRSLILLLAEAYAQQQKFTLMEDTLASLPPDHPGAEQLRKRMQTAQDDTIDDGIIDDSLPDKTLTTRVSLEKYGEHYLVEVDLQGTHASLMLDTGASSTAISQQVYRQLQRFSRLQMLGLFDVNTASGPIRAPLVKIASLTLGPYTLKDIGVLVLPRNFSGDSDGLLGMNVLKQFRFQLDQDKAELVLAVRN